MRVVGIALGTLVLLLILLGIIPDVLLVVPFAILFGWIPAAIRLGSNLPFSAGEVAPFFAASLLLVCGVHWFLRQFKPWRFRWTAAITGGVGLVLLAIMSVVGVAHQSGWILASKESLFVNRSRWIRDQLENSRQDLPISQLLTHLRGNISAQGGEKIR